MFSFLWSGLREVRALVYWEKPHFSTEWKLLTPSENKGTAPRTQPCPSTPRTGTFGNTGMMHPTHFFLEHLRRLGAGVQGSTSGGNPGHAKSQVEDHED